MLCLYTPEISYEKEKIYRRLQIRENTPAYDYTENVFPSLLQLALENMELFLCYQMIPSLSEGTFSLPEPCEKWVLCLVTCSERMNQTIQQKLDEGEYLEGYLLNDLANEILFNASNQMNCLIRREVQSMGLHLTRRYSPGEPPLDLAYQEELLQILGKEQPLPVTLNSHFMLHPEKSMLYLFGAASRPSSLSESLGCAECSSRNCPYAESP